MGGRRRRTSLPSPTARSRPSRRRSERVTRRGSVPAGLAEGGESHMRSHGRVHAYTLIELIIVIAMLGLATAVVVPSIGSTDVLRVQSTVRTIVADINCAQSDALARQQGRAMVFD